jgi:hypothetical protein
VSFKLLNINIAIANKDKSDITIRSSDKSASQFEEKHSDSDKAKLKDSNFKKQVVHMKDKIIINNRKLIQAKNQKRLNETLQTVNVNAERRVLKRSK